MRSKCSTFYLVIAVVARHVAETDTKIAEGTTVDEGTMADVIMMIDVALTRLLLLRSVKIRSFHDDLLSKIEVITSKG